MLMWRHICAQTVLLFVNTDSMAVKIERMRSRKMFRNPARETKNRMSESSKRNVLLVRKCTHTFTMTSVPAAHERKGRKSGAWQARKERWKYASYLFVNDPKNGWF